MFKKALPFLVFLLFLILSSVNIYADQVIYMCQAGLDTEINVSLYLQTGEIEMLNGFSGDKKTIPGPAPPPYPEVMIWEKGIEQLGKRVDRIDDGIHFTGRRWTPGKKSLVIWKIRVRDASFRLPSEFEEDIYLALWIDWNQDDAWAKDERMISASINIHDHFPTNKNHLEIRFLSWFNIPGDSNLFSILKDKDKDKGKDEKNVWVRGIIAYDDPDTSPDGECLFGDVEDYRVTYKIKAPEEREEDDDDDDEGESRFPIK